MTIKAHPWTLAIVYTILSLGVEIVLLVVVGLKIPEDNRLIAPVVLTIPPIAAALICGYRRPKVLLLAAGLLAVLTLALTWTANTLTGIRTGLLEPIVVRSLAGLIAGRLLIGHPRSGSLVQGVE